MRQRHAPQSDKDGGGAASAAAASLPKQRIAKDPTAGGVGFIKSRPVTLVLVLCPALLLLVWSCLFLLPPTQLQLFPSSQEHLPSSSRPSAPPPPSSPEAAGSSSHAPLLSPDLFVWWMAPIFSGGGYCSEALSYLVPLHSKVARLRVSQHGDAFHRDFVLGLPAELRSLLTRLYATPLPSLDDPAAARMVVVCHSEAGAWYPPRYETSFCPPPVSPQAKTKMYRVGRTMFETDRIPDGWAERCNDMDEIWVPTEFHRHTFAANGVKPEKLHVLPQPVNSTFFDPAKAERDDGKLDELLLPAASFGAAWKDVDRSAFRFFSSFKWERRKGWDILLKAYFEEFSTSDSVVLVLLTNLFHAHPDFSFAQEIASFISSSSSSSSLQSKVDEGTLPPVIILGQHVAQTNLPFLYHNMDAFVLPTRGEGWGRPIVEAMSMALPVIATNWSGPTAFMRDDNSYPLEIEGLSEVPEGPFKGHKWAEPSVPLLRQLMRRVVENKGERELKGKKARQDMVDKFNPEVVSSILEQRLFAIQQRLN